jgi:Peptidase family M23
MKLPFASPLLLLTSLVVLLIVHALGDPTPALAASPSVGPSKDDGTLRLARRWTETFYRGDLAPLWSQLDDKVRALFGTVEGLAAFREKVQTQLGAEQAIVSETVEPEDGSRLYVRTARFERSPQPFQVKMTFDAHDRIVAFGVLPAPTSAPAPSTKLDYRTKTRLQLPFEGTWAVGWGGRTLAENYHAANREQRFAYDLLVAHGESTHNGDGTHNGDYFCHGLPIFAPGDGRVVEARDGIAENVPGQMNSQEPLGNHVILDHGNGELSFMAHFETGSLVVHSGDRVTAGQRIARCGNSGLSSEPHLHYHLQTTPRLHDGEGLPAQFHDYVADGKPVAVGEPTRGQLISPAAAGAHGAAGRR